MFENFRTFETDFAGRPLVIETGKMAQLANGECLVRYGDTVVHVAVTASAKPREGVDFFPLSVDFEEKLYAVGKIPGSFLKREGRPSDKAILTSRVIDRPIRPLFPKDMRNDVSVVCTVMSVDHDCLPEIAAMVGTSIALTISDIPWNGPISGVSVGLIDGEYIINPTSEQREKSRMAVTVASTDERIAMIEAGANERHRRGDVQRHHGGPRGQPEDHRVHQGHPEGDRQGEVQLSEQRAGRRDAQRHQGIRHGGRKVRPRYGRQERPRRTPQADL